MDGWNEQEKRSLSKMHLPIIVLNYFFLSIKNIIHIVVSHFWNFIYYVVHISNYIIIILNNIAIAILIRLCKSHKARKRTKPGDLHLLAFAVRNLTLPSNATAFLQSKFKWILLLLPLLIVRTVNSLPSLYIIFDLSLDTSLSCRSISTSSSS